MEAVQVKPYNPDWSDLFEQEITRIGAVLKKELVIGQHIGSTAIPDLWARPVIDILVEVRAIETVDRLEAELQALGYKNLGEHGVPGRRFLIRNEDDRRAVNLYIFPVGHPEIQRLLDFRDYLLTHAQEARFYSLLKQELAERYAEDLLNYMNAKEDFIHAVLRRAEAWRTNTTDPPAAEESEES